MRNIKDPRASQLATLRIALRVSRQRCLLLERQVSRLLSSDPIVAAEAEVARLERRVIDCEDRWSEAESENYALRKALGWQERRAGGGTAYWGTTCLFTPAVDDRNATARIDAASKRNVTGISRNVTFHLCSIRLSPAMLASLQRRFRTRALTLCSAIRPMSARASMKVSM